MGKPIVADGGAGVGVLGTSITNDGVVGQSESAFGVFAKSNTGVGLRATSITGRAIEAQAKGDGVGIVAQSDGGIGLFGISLTHNGVKGQSNSNFGVFASSESGVGLRATSLTGRAIEAQAKGGGIGVVAQSEGGDGVFGISGTGVGVHGKSEGSDGVFGISGTGVGVHGKGGRLAGFFEGNVHISGNLLIDGDVQLSGADIAEQFQLVGGLDAEPGTVVVIAGDDRIRVCDAPYDRRVAGVISGAGNYRPAIVLDRRIEDDRRALALTGKIWCKIDADPASIEIGDLLTTSALPGHAMKALDPARSFGAIVGKALQPLDSGQGMIPILITLH